MSKVGTYRWQARQSVRHDEIAIWRARWDAASPDDRHVLIDELLEAYECVPTLDMLDLLALAALVDDRAVALLVDELYASAPWGERRSATWAFDGGSERSILAVCRLADLGPRAIPQLIAALQYPEREERALQTFDAMGPALETYCKQLGLLDDLRRVLLAHLETIGLSQARLVARVLRSLGAEQHLMAALGRLLRRSDALLNERALLHERALELVPPDRIEELAADAIVAHLQHGAKQWHIESLLRRTSAAALNRLSKRFPRVQPMLTWALSAVPLETQTDREAAAHLLLRSLQQRDPSSSVALQRLAARGRLDLLLPALESATPAERWLRSCLRHTRPWHTILLAAVYELIDSGLDDPRRDPAVAAGIRLIQKVAPRASRTRELVDRARASTRSALREPPTNG